MIPKLFAPSQRNRRCLQFARFKLPQNQEQNNPNKIHTRSFGFQRPRSTTPKRERSTTASEKTSQIYSSDKNGLVKIARESANKHLICSESRDVWNDIVFQTIAVTDEFNIEDLVDISESFAMVRMQNKELISLIVDRFNLLKSNLVNDNNDSMEKIVKNIILISKAFDAFSKLDCVNDVSWGNIFFQQLEKLKFDNGAADFLLGELDAAGSDNNQNIMIQNLKHLIESPTISLTDLVPIASLYGYCVFSENRQNFETEHQNEQETKRQNFLKIFQTLQTKFQKTTTLPISLLHANHTVHLLTCLEHLPENLLKTKQEFDNNGKIDYRDFFFYPDKNNDKHSDINLFPIDNQNIEDIDDTFSFHLTQINQNKNKPLVPQLKDRIKDIAPRLTCWEASQAFLSLAKIQWGEELDCVFQRIDWLLSDVKYVPLECKTDKKVSEQNENDGENDKKSTNQTLIKSAIINQFTQQDVARILQGFQFLFQYGNEKDKAVETLRRIELEIKHDYDLKKVEENMKKSITKQISKPLLNKLLQVAKDDSNHNGNTLKLISEMLKLLNEKNEDWLQFLLKDQRGVLDSDLGFEVAGDLVKDFKEFVRGG